MTQYTSLTPFPASWVLAMCEARLAFVEDTWQDIVKKYTSDARSKIWARLFYKGASDEVIFEKFVNGDKNHSYHWHKAWQFSDEHDLFDTLTALAKASIQTNGPDARVFLSADDFIALRKTFLGVIFVPILPDISEYR